MERREQRKRLPEMQDFTHEERRLQSYGMSCLQDPYLLEMLGNF
jgi:hypothetical protein